jgi:hypothetical protein
MTFFKRFPSSFALWSLGTNFAETEFIPKSSVKIVWLELMDIPTSSSTSQSVSQHFQWVQFFTLAIRVLDFEVADWPDCLLSSLEVLPF